MDSRQDPQYSEQTSLSEGSPTKSATQDYVLRRDTEDLHDTRGTQGIRSTMKLKLSVLFSALLSLALMCLAAAQSYKRFITLGYASLTPDNSRTAAINAVVAVYGAVTGMTTRIAVTKFLNLVSIRALTRNGKFIWTAKTWAYMSHANGPWYTLGPLFAAGLAATAVISILPAATIDAGHYVEFQVAPSLQQNERSCFQVGDIWCTGASLAAQLLQSYSGSIGGYAQNGDSPELYLQNQISSNRSLGYPWQLVNDRENEYTKYNVSGGASLQLSNKTACVWVLDQVPIRCSFLNYTENDDQLEVRSPYSGRTYFFNNDTVPPQGIDTNTVGDLTEIAGLGYFLSIAQSECGPWPCTAYVCTSRRLTEVHVGRYITFKASNFVDYIDIANDTSCEPAYDLPSSEDVQALVYDMAQGIYQFASVDGTNFLIESFTNSFFEINIPMFRDSTSQLEDGMGSFVALMLSNLYYAAEGGDHDAPNATRVDGGLMVATVGLGPHSTLYVWLVLAVLPLLALIIAVCMPLDYIPSWDVMNPMDALATEAIIDEEVATARGRSSGIRLGMVDGRIIASNTNLPTRISKENMS